MDILDIVRQSFETDEKVLFKRLFINGRKHVDLMFTYIGVSFRLMGFSRDVVIAFLIDELEILKSFLAENGTLSSAHANIIVAQMQHCLAQDTTTQNLLGKSVDECNMLAANKQTSSNIDSNVGRDT